MRVFKILCAIVRFQKLRGRETEMNVRARVLRLKTGPRVERLLFMYQTASVPSQPVVTQLPRKTARCLFDASHAVIPATPASF